MESAQDSDSEPFHWHFADLDDRDFQIHGRTVFFTVVIFAIVIIFALIFIYARWLCSSHLPHEPSPSSHAPPPPPPQQPRGLDPDAINALPLTIATRGSECCICLGVFEDDEKVKALPYCRHCYHPECVDKWLSAESSCPLCRTSLRVELDRDLHRNIPDIIVTQ
ncbi:Arabidopsis Toxicos en Levadura 66 [Hibiscus trionum]|uniref:RING-type E3 ubiquitin transferase n=1 Tax=Hibiscus trionum TaxID=183268 RepID=A0A9W7H912_HIBTR|nr:Arabidopsis Toxicos en Levadura 66 [Hibiscus trionum]